MFLNSKQPSFSLIVHWFSKTLRATLLLPYQWHIFSTMFVAKWRLFEEKIDCRKLRPVSTSNLLATRQNGKGLFHEKAQECVYCHLMVARNQEACNEIIKDQLKVTGYASLFSHSCSRAGRTSSMANLRNKK